jgi:tetratricopeptide (TPR) repeat protein
MSAHDADRPPAPARRWVVGVLLVAFAWRVVHVLAMRASPLFDAPIMDAAYHVEWARAWASGERFQPGQPLFRAPLYPAFLALTQLLCGEDLLAPRLLQALLGTWTTWLVVQLGSRACDARVGLVAGLLAATSWVLVYFDGELLIETLFVPLLLCALLATLDLERSGARAALRCGLWLGVAALARPNALLVAAALVPWLLLRARPGGWRAAAMLALGTLAPVLPVTIWNATGGGAAVLVSSQAGVNLWIGNNPESDGSTAIVPGTRGGWWEGYHDARAQACAEAGRELSDAEISSHYSRKAWAWIRAQPRAALRLLLWKLRLFWLDWELGNNQEIRFFARRYDPLARVFALPFAVLAGLGLVGMALALRQRRLEPLLGFVVVYMCGVVAFFVCSRFRVPVLPVLMVFAAHALVRGFDAARARRFGPLALGALAAAGFAAFSAQRPRALVDGRATGHLQLGDAALARGDTAQAISLYEQGLGYDPDNRHLRVWLGKAVRAAGEAPRARRIYAELLADEPGMPEAVVGLVAVLSEDLGETEQAERVARAALAERPAQAAVLYQLGAVLVLRADRERDPALLEEARSTFARTLELDPRFFGAAYMRGECARALGRPGEAIDAYGRAIDLAAHGEERFVTAAYEQLIALLHAAGDDARADRRRAELDAWRGR